MLDKEIRSVRAKMEVVCRELLDLESEYRILLERSGEDRPFTWFEYASYVLKAERANRQDEVYLERSRRQFQEIADRLRAEGVDPETIYLGWEWVDGKPTGKMMRS